MYKLMCVFEGTRWRRWRVLDSIPVEREFKLCVERYKYNAAATIKVLSIPSVVRLPTGSFVSPRRVVLSTLKRFSTEAQRFGYCYDVFGRRVLSDFPYADIDEVFDMAYDLQFLDGSIGFLCNGEYAVVDFHHDFSRQVSNNSV